MSKLGLKGLIQTCINADNGLSFLAPSADSHKKVNLANSDTLLSTVCCLKRPFL